MPNYFPQNNLTNATPNNSQNDLQKGLQYCMAIIGPEVISHPFSTIYTTQQTYLNGKNPTFYQAISTIRKGGGFYAGFSPQAIASIPATGFYLQGRSFSLSLFGENHVGYFMQGPIGTSAGMLFWAPAGRLSTLQQASGISRIDNPFNQLSITQKAQYIWKKEGLRGLYRGAIPMTYAYSIGDAIGSWLLGLTLLYYPQDERKKFIPQLFSTLLSFSTAAILTSPLDAIGAHLRVAETDPSNFKDKTTLQAIRTIYRNKGFPGFFNGLPASVLRANTWYFTLPCVAYLNESTPKNNR